MRVQVYAVGRGVYVFDDVVAIWSDGEVLRVQHHANCITVFALFRVREIERIDDIEEGVSSVLGWTDRQLQKVA